MLLSIVCQSTYGKYCSAPKNWVIFFQNLKYLAKSALRKHGHDTQLTMSPPPTTLPLHTTNPLPTTHLPPCTTLPLLPTTPLPLPTTSLPLLLTTPLTPTTRSMIPM